MKSELLWSNLRIDIRVVAAKTNPEIRICKLKPKTLIYWFSISYQMMGEAHLRVLDALTEDQSITTLHEQTGYSMGRVHEVVEELEQNGLVVTKRRNRNRRVASATETAVFRAYRRLQSQHSHIDFPELLSRRTLHVCWFLDQPRKVSEIADRLPITRQRVYQLLAPLQERAMLTKDGTQYKIADDLTNLVEFARAFVDHEHAHRVREYAPSAVVLWSTPAEALVSVESKQDREQLVDTDNGAVSGLARYEEYGLTFFGANQPPVFYSELDTEITVEQLVCHTLVAKTDSRRTSYALLLLTTTAFDEDRLRATATEYGVTGLIEDMLSFLHGEPTSSEYIPNTRDIEALKQQYEVTS